MCLVSFSYFHPLLGFPLSISRVLINLAMQTLNKNTPKPSKLSMPTEEKSATQNAHSINTRFNLYKRGARPSKQEKKPFVLDGRLCSANRSDLVQRAGFEPANPYGKGSLTGAFQANNSDLESFAFNLAWRPLHALRFPNPSYLVIC